MIRPFALCVCVCVCVRSQVREIESLIRLEVYPTFKFYHGNKEVGELKSADTNGLVRRLNDLKTKSVT